MEDGEESAVGTWEDSYAKLAQVRGQMCLQPYVQSGSSSFSPTPPHPTPTHLLASGTATEHFYSIATRSLRHAEGCFPTVAPRASFQGPIDTTTFRFKAGSLTGNQLKCCGFVQCRTYLAPPREGDTPFKGGQMFHMLAYMPDDQQPWRSRIEWMKNSAEGGFASRKWMYGRGSIVGMLNTRLLEEEPGPGQDILVVLVDEFGFTSRASFDGGSVSGNGGSPQKARAAEQGRNPFSSSPVGSHWKGPAADLSPSGGRTGSGKGKVVDEDVSLLIAEQLSPLPD